MPPPPPPTIYFLRLCYAYPNLMGPEPAGGAVQSICISVFSSLSLCTMEICVRYHIIVHGVTNNNYMMSHTFGGEQSLSLVCVSKGIPIKPNKISAGVKAPAGMVSLATRRPCIMAPRKVGESLLFADVNATAKIIK